MKKRLLYLVVILLSIQPQLFAQQTQNEIDKLGLIPLPLEVSTSQGTFTFPEEVIILAKTSDEVNTASFLSDYFKAKERKATISNSGQSTSISLITDKSITDNEGYRLTVDNKGVVISASTGAGLFYGAQTLLQLLPANPSNDISVAFVTISDKPAFKWRGNMLDVSRHFFPVEFIKKHLDILASYKINTFHWHLTDDQGWRIEIKKYPKLTEVSAFRKETLIGAQQGLKTPEDFKYDGVPYGGFYTQEQVKEVVAYAQKRHITIVPEIEMPGHSVAVLAAYPELACKPGKYETFTRWGITDDIVCPSEQTFQFFENVLSEVVQLFPGKYVHIGGDEAPKKVWRESDDVKKIMKKNKIKDVEKVQGWFNSRIEKFLESKGKKLIGWDEILEGGITPKSTIMSWRGEKGGIEAAKHGNDVVMSPTTHFYLDYGQHPQPHSPLEPLMICCYLPIEKVYSYNPLSTELTAEQHKKILGVQANLWTEYITTPNKVEFMLYPRLLALSEVAWSPNERKNFESFETRLTKQFALLDAKEVNYRIPHPEGLDSASVVKTGDKATITLSSIVPGAEIRYTLDGHIPDETTSLYTKPLELPLNRKIKVMAVTIAPSGRHSSAVEFTVN
jgi:hexosaminidase